MTTREPTAVLPEVLAQIRALPGSDKPLIICDVDEVILHMVLHLEEYLHANGLMFLKHEYRLTGNICGKSDRVLISSDDVRRHLLIFFSTRSATGRTWYAEPMRPCCNWRQTGRSSS
ncbi:hypothetical protein QW131_06410 [Roseibium salinum]|nr:hypothetical protein [Roseibium salinum]